MSVWSGNVENHLGRYELVDPAINANKYWECLPDADHPGKYGTRWGRIGAKNTQNAKKLNVTGSYVADKINEKIRQGYRFVGKVEEVIQARLANEVADRLDERTAPALGGTRRSNRL